MQGQLSSASDLTRIQQGTKGTGMGNLGALAEAHISCELADADGVRGRTAAVLMSVNRTLHKC